MRNGQGLASVAVALALATSLGAALAPLAHADGGGTVAPGIRTVVAFDGPLPQDDRFHGAPVLRTHAEAATLVVQATAAQAAVMRDDPRVRLVQPDQPLASLGTPNDPKWSQQWGPGAIQAIDAWDATPGSDSIRIAVIDTGIDTDHEDRPEALVLGPDYGDNDHSPEDANGHGTWVAGILAGARDNAIGTAGLANVEVYVIKVFSNSGTGYTSYLDQAIAHAIGVGADIITMSIAFHTADSLVQQRIEAATDAGILLIAAAGNENGGPVLYPAAYPEVIAVSSVDQSLGVAAHSSVGSAVELAAPGVDIKGPWRGGGYAGATGTSGAAPHVAAAAGLVWSLAPELTAAEVRAALTATARDLGPPGRDHGYGHGLVQVYDALTAVFDHMPGHSVGEVVPLAVPEGTTVPWHVGGVPVGATGFTWSFDGDDAFDDGSGVARDWTTPGDASAEAAVRYETPDGQTGIVRRAVHVENIAPTIHTVSAVDEAVAQVPVAFAIDATDPGDPIVLHIDWGDGSHTETNTSVATHAWADAGTYTVRVTADDGDGGTDTATHVIRIGDDGTFVAESLHVRPDNLLPTNLVPLSHPTQYLVDVTVTLETGGPVEDIRIDFVLRNGALIETFASRSVSADAAGRHTIPLTVPLDMTLYRPGDYIVDARLDPARDWRERIETNNIIMTTMTHLG